MPKTLTWRISSSKLYECIKFNQEILLNMFIILRKSLITFLFSDLLHRNGSHNVYQVHVFQSELPTIPFHHFLFHFKDTLVEERAPKLVTVSVGLAFSTLFQVLY